MMDRLGPQPVTLAALFERLRRGEVWQAIGSDGTVYELSVNTNEQIILKQAGQEQLFRQIETAVMTLLGALGKVSPKESPPSPS
jgi:hypothetical protein